jgi:hypothetical protein
MIHRRTGLCEENTDFHELGENHCLPARTRRGDKCSESKRQSVVINYKSSLHNCKLAYQDKKRREVKEPHYFPPWLKSCGLVIFNDSAVGVSYQ